jgi:hypothetical protein
LLSRIDDTVGGLSSTEVYPSQGVPVLTATTKDACWSESTSAVITGQTVSKCSITGLLGFGAAAAVQVSAQATIPSIRPKNRKILPFMATGFELMINELQ